MIPVPDYCKPEPVLGRMIGTVIRWAIGLFILRTVMFWWIG